MFRSVLVAGLLTVLVCNAFSADQSVKRAKKPPNEVTIVSLPPPQPTEVKVVSIPPTPPPQVTVNVPKDESAAELVKATWGLLIATVVLAFATFCVGRWQSRDTKRRDRAAMMREVSRNANRVMVQATRVQQIAEQIPAARNHLSVLGHQGGMPPSVKEEIEKALQERKKHLTDMTNQSLDIVSGNLFKKSDRELTADLWRLDSHQEQLEMMREAITDELSRYESESLTIRESNVAMQAAALGAKLSQPPKKTLG